MLELKPVQQPQLALTMSCTGPGTFPDAKIAVEAERRHSCMATIYDSKWGRDATF
ncbi:MAG: hypothetical protein M1570_07680 [Chloroflexi bacterium]|nr:hypothetical protein [Chloroflexota bacterium]